METVIQGLIAVWRYHLVETSDCAYGKWCKDADKSDNSIIIVYNTESPEGVLEHHIEWVY